MPARPCLTRTIHAIAPATAPRNLQTERLPSLDRKRTSDHSALGQARETPNDHTHRQSPHQRRMGTSGRGIRKRWCRPHRGTSRGQPSLPPRRFIPMRFRLPCLYGGATAQTQDASGEAVSSAPPAFRRRLACCAAIAPPLPSHVYASNSPLGSRSSALADSMGAPLPA